MLKQRCKYNNKTMHVKNCGHNNCNNACKICKFIYWGCKCFLEYKNV